MNQKRKPVVINFYLEGCEIPLSTIIDWDETELTVSSASAYVRSRMAPHLNICVTRCKFL